MNQVFNIQRLSLLLQKHWGENIKRYALSAIALLGLLVLWFVLFLLMDQTPEFSERTQTQVYCFILFLGGAIYASRFFQALGSRPKGINFLQTPASVFEKFLCSLLYCTVFYFIVITIAFYSVDILMISIANTINKASGHAHIKSEIANVFHTPGSSFNLFLVFLFVQSLFLLGSIYFQRSSLIKIILVIFVIFLLVVAFEAVFMGQILRGNFFHGFTSYQVHSDFSKTIELPAWVETTILYLLKYGMPLTFWFITYFRLKEKEI